jgi:hypothetical protein
MRAVCFGILWAFSLAFYGCSDSQSAPSGIAEPLRVSNAQFFPGSFPSSNPTGPQISQLSVKNSEFVAGTDGKVIAGLAGAGSQSVALALQGMGSGFWVMPVGAPDLQEPGTFSWSATCDFAHDLPEGITPLQIAASDSSGQFGPITIESLNIHSIIPEGHVVASLTWGVNADLDIHLVTPSGKELYYKHPNSGDVDAGVPDPGSGLLDRDSLASCIPDGLRTEDVIWPDGDDPDPGKYTVRVDMFSACSQPAASFVFTLSVDGSEVQRKTGRLLAIDADGGGPGSGLYITQFTCEGSTCS